MMSDELAPHMEFERKPVAYKDEDGHTLYRDEYFVSVRQRGGTDGNDYKAQEWLDKLKSQGYERAGFDQNASIYASWYDEALRKFEAFKKGEEVPEDGMSLKAFPGFSPAEVLTCKAVNIYTLEQLSEATEQALSHMGPGARSLKTKATKMLENYHSGKVAEENAALRLRLDEMEAKYAELDQLTKSLLADEREAKKGRPRKDEAA